MKTFFETYKQLIFPSIFLGKREADIFLKDVTLHFRYERRAHGKLGEIITFYVHHLTVLDGTGDGKLFAQKRDWLDKVEDSVGGMGGHGPRYGFASTKADFEDRLAQYIYGVKLADYKDDILSFFRKDTALIGTSFIKYKKIPVRLRLSQAKGQIFDYLKTNGQTHLNELVNKLVKTYGKSDKAYYTQISLAEKEGTLINNNDAISINYDVAELY